MGAGSGETSVHRNGLITMARFWDTSAGTLNTASQDASACACDIYAGVFTEYVSVYNQLGAQVSTWCLEGGTQMDKIGSALVNAAKHYDDTENRNSAAAGRVGHHH